MKKDLYRTATFVLFFLVVSALAPSKVFGGLLEDVPNGKLFALVIGNDNYTYLPNLSESIKDATAVANRLKKIGFDVIHLSNATSSEMIDAIDDFTVRLRSTPDSQGFFWYSGRGVQLDYMGHIVGTDAGTDVQRVRTGIVSLGRLFESISTARNKMNVVIVDATFVPLDKTETPVSLELPLLDKFYDNICYIRSVSPGEQASDDSPFCPSVIKNMDTPSDVAQTFLVIAGETASASRNAQKPLYYLPGKMSGIK